MSYVRVKKIKGRDYAYLVRSTWLKGKKQPKQSVSKYLGKVISSTDKKALDFAEFTKIQDIAAYVQSKKKEEIVHDLLSWELAKHKIRQVNIDVAAKTVISNGKDVAVRMNDGFLAGHTLQELMKFRLPRTGEDGYELAKRFVEAGIAIPKDMFVALFESNIFK